MAQFTAFAPHVMVNGETVLSVVDGLGSFKALGMKILDEQGIHEPKAGQWYAQQSWLNAFKAISLKLGPSTLLKIGRSIPDNAKFPPTITTLEGGLASIDVAYHMNHRGGEIGSYKYHKLGEHSGELVAHTPYPCDLDRGIASGTAAKFKPAGSTVHVEHEKTKGCRNLGAEACTYIVTW